MNLESSPMLSLCALYEIPQGDGGDMLEAGVAAARQGASSGAVGLCLVSDEVYLSAQGRERLARLASAIKSQNPGLHLIATGGIASVEDLDYLKSSGLMSYHHGLFSSRAFFERALQGLQTPQEACLNPPHTPQWKQHFATCEHAYNAELGLCSSGCFGLGEGWGDRIELLKMLQILSPHSVILHFGRLDFGTTGVLKNMENLEKDKEERLECIALSRELLPKTRLMMELDSEILESSLLHSISPSPIHSLYQAGIRAFIAPCSQIGTFAKHLTQEGYRLAQSCH